MEERALVYLIKHFRVFGISHSRTLSPAFYAFIYFSHNILSLWNIYDDAIFLELVLPLKIPYTWNIKCFARRVIILEKIDSVCCLLEFLWSRMLQSTNDSILQFCSFLIKHNKLHTENVTKTEYISPFLLPFRMQK